MTSRIGSSQFTSEAYCIGLALLKTRVNTAIAPCKSRLKQNANCHHRFSQQYPVCWHNRLNFASSGRSIESPPFCFICFSVFWCSILPPNILKPGGFLEHIHRLTELYLMSHFFFILWQTKWLLVEGEEISQSVCYCLTLNNAWLYTRGERKCLHWALNHFFFFWISIFNSPEEPCLFECSWMLPTRISLRKQMLFIQFQDSKNKISHLVCITSGFQWSQ